MFSPGITCKLCGHVSKIDDNQNDPVEEHMQSGFFSLIDHVHSAKIVSTLSLILFHSASITKFHGVMARYAHTLVCKANIYDEPTVAEYSSAGYEKVNSGADYIEVVVAMKETVKMMTKQEMSELETQEQNKKECREAGANDENEE